jgi:hypothetical protein
MNHRASALLISFFMMTILLLLVLGVNGLVLRDLRSMNLVVAGTQAEYAAEGMSELGLHALKTHLPGYEPELEDIEFSNSVLASLSIDARDAVVPCLADGEEWRTLDYNESIQLPLFAQTSEEAHTDKILSFYIEFYVGNAEGDGQPVSSDVLRWKILGLNGGGQTEAISEFIPLDLNRFTNLYPTVFGSATDAVPDKYATAKFHVEEGGKFVFYPVYPIRTFLERHDFNYLVLTNVARNGEPFNKIHFRLKTTDHEPVCEFVTLSASAETPAGNQVRQSLQTRVREGENLPVFDFVLYHTDGE